MTDRDCLEKALDEVAAGKRIAYLGPQVSALSGADWPATPEALCAVIETQVRAPRRASGNLWSVAQCIESRKFRATLDKIVGDAFDGVTRTTNPIHDCLARVRPPMVVDTWYDDGILNAFDGRDWGLVQGVSRNGEWIDLFTRSYDRRGKEVAGPDPAWQTLVYKPHGLGKTGSS